MHHSPPTHSDTSLPANAHPPHAHPRATTASRFFVSMRKSFVPQSSLRRKDTESPRAAMYSTPEERHAYHVSRAGPSRYLDSRPTIEQIAMGLHVSRTPHLRAVPNPLQRHPIPSPPPHHAVDTSIRSLPVSSDNIHDTSTSSSQHRTRHSLPPPPSRSSMKKTSSSTSALAHPQRRFSSSAVAQSSSVVISGGAPGTSRPMSSLRARVSKFIPGYRPLSLPFSLGRASSVTSSASDSTRPTTPRKAVRFSTSVLAIDEQSS